MAEPTLQKVDMYSENHYYTAEIDGESVTIIDRDGDGQIVQGMDEIISNGFSPTQQEAAFKKYGTVSQDIVTRFRDELPEELERVKESLEGVEEKPTYSNMCILKRCMAGKIDLKIAREKVRGTSKVRDENQDGKADRISFKTSAGVDVSISSIFWTEARPFEDTCTRLDLNRAGVEEFLKVFDRPGELDTDRDREFFDLKEEAAEEFLKAR